jgi:hypothetical protein
MLQHFRQDILIPALSITIKCGLSAVLIGLPRGMMFGIPMTGKTGPKRPAALLYRQELLTPVLSITTRCGLSEAVEKMMFGMRSKGKEVCPENERTVCNGENLKAQILALINGCLSL